LDFECRELLQSAQSTIKAIGDLRERLAFAEPEVLDSATYKGKKRIQRRMFTEGVFYGKTGFGTPATHSIYTFLSSDLMDESTWLYQELVEIENKQDIGTTCGATPIYTPPNLVFILRFPAHFVALFGTTWDIA